MSTITDWQLIVDSSDPFLVEAMYNKSDEELDDVLTRLNRELSSVHPKNINRINYYNKSIQAVQAMLEVRHHQRQDDRQGYTIT